MPVSFFPLGTREIERIERLQACFPDDRDRRPAILLRLANRPFGSGFGLGADRHADRQPGSEAEAAQELSSCIRPSDFRRPELRCGH